MLNAQCYAMSIASIATLPAAGRAAGGVRAVSKHTLHQSEQPVGPGRTGFLFSENISRRERT